MPGSCTRQGHVPVRHLGRPVVRLDNVDTGSILRDAGGRGELANRRVATPEPRRSVRESPLRPVECAGNLRGDLISENSVSHAEDTLPVSKQVVRKAYPRLRIKHGRGETGLRYAGINSVPLEARIARRGRSV